MRTDQVFTKSGDSLKCEDLQGRRVTVEIESYVVKKFDDGAKPILRFVGKEKSLVVNQTNAYTIEQVLGTNEMDEWIGGRITLKPAKTKFNGKMVDCIRVDDQAPTSATPPRPRPAPKPEPRDEGDQPWEASDSDVPF